MHLVWKEVFPHIFKNSKVLKAFWKIVIEGAITFYDQLFSALLVNQFLHAERKFCF